MEVKVVVSIDDCTASLLENLINALGNKIVQKTVPVATFPTEEETEVAPWPKAPTKPNSESAAPQVEKDKQIKPIGLEDIRGIARQLADNGRQAEYREILKHFGYEKVNQIKEEDYVAIYKEMIDLVDGVPC